MPIYHCYILDQQNHVKARQAVTAGSDQAATEKAKAYLGEHPAIHRLSFGEKASGSWRLLRSALNFIRQPGSTGGGPTSGTMSCLGTREV
jgi:hypothetical protein